MLVDRASADEVTVENTLPRTLSLVIDRSGSMDGDKIAQARDAARAMLDNLRATDEIDLSIDARYVGPAAAPAESDAGGLTADEAAEAEFAEEG